MTLEEFADFQCPSCGIYYGEIKKIEEEFGTRLRVIFREYPLYPNHEHSVLAAQAAEAAGMQGRFWDMHDKLYENQKAWTDEKDALPFFVDYARAIGLDMDRFNRDLNSDAVAATHKMDRVTRSELKHTTFHNGTEAKGDCGVPKFCGDDQLRVTGAPSMSAKAPAGDHSRRKAGLLDRDHSP